MMSARLLYLQVLVVLILLTACQTVGSPAHSLLQRGHNTQATTLSTFGTDPVIDLLGRSFDEIEGLLGSPDDQGYSDWLGPHYYILFRHGERIMRICSPEHFENRIAGSIILGPGQRVLGAEVGMLFGEIEAMLGAPEFGPERGMDDLYYMDYYFGKVLDDGMPEVFVSFSSRDLDSPTHEAFIKREILKSPVLESGFRVDLAQ